MKGLIKEVHADRGFHFVVGDDGLKRFAHVKWFLDGQNAFDSAQEGQLVDFRPGDGERGPRAYDIRVLPEVVR